VQPALSFLSVERLEAHTQKRKKDDDDDDDSTTTTSPSLPKKNKIKKKGKKKSLPPHVFTTSQTRISIDAQHTRSTTNSREFFESK